MTNKSVLILMIGALVLAGVEWLMIRLDLALQAGEHLIEIGVNAAHLLAIYLLFKNSSIRQTRYWRIILICFSLLLLGALFKIMHWPGAGMLLSLGSISIAVTYVIRYLFRSYKGLLETLKMLWVVTAFTNSLTRIMHWLPEEYSIVPDVLLWLTVLVFVVDSYRKGQLFNN